jgi:DNA-binding CsgD family transcriptional regulator
LTLHTHPDPVFIDVPPLNGNESGPDEGAALLAVLMDELASGIVIVDAEGRVLQLNEAARRVLDAGTVLQMFQGELRPFVAEDAKALKSAIVSASTGQRSLLRLAGASADFSVAVVPLQKQVGSSCERMALILSRASVAESGVFAAFARNHGLTHTEEQVLGFLCRCLSTPQIAVQMKVAVSTVRSHVRSVCSKTASSGVRELVNRVAVLPPIAPLSFGHIH